MKNTLTTLKTFCAVALVALAVGCASTQIMENELVAAGFKVITPGTPEQAAQLKVLEPNKVALIHKDGKTYYLFPDAAHNQAYIGGPKQFQAYKNIRAAQQAAYQNAEAAVMKQNAPLSAEGWSGWNNWDRTGEPNWY